MSTGSDEDNVKTPADPPGGASGQSEPANLGARREEVLRSFVRRGVELTEELIREHEQLQERLDRLENENARLRAQIASDDAIRELLTKITELEGERRALLDRSRQLEHARRQHEGRYHELEQELNDLASLYVASHQLSATLRPRRVVRHICELLEQLVGCQQAVVYLIRPGGQTAAPVATLGLSEAPGVLPLAGGMVADACLTGVVRVRELGGEGDGVSNGPLAVIPLVVGEQAVAVITVLQLLPHKRSWESVDRELFNLLSQHGPAALIAATLYHGQPGPREALAGLEKILEEDAAVAVPSSSGEGSE
ncbi:MAG: GAF domain-containing protein [Myxococcales bacterium]